jgi:RimJ/RimL family protein N-acetyltransferase
MIPRKLNILDKHKLTVHLQSLKGEDRRLRFGCVATDAYIETYVNKTINDVDSKWFGIDHIDGHLVAACHVAITEELAELGCSVDPEYRGHGFAQDMFDRAVTWLRARGIQDVVMHCLAENAIMKHIARKNDMSVVTEYGESDANVHLEPATPVVHIADAYADRMAMYDMIYKQNIKAIRTFMPKYWYESQSN